MDYIKETLTDNEEITKYYEISPWIYRLFYGQTLLAFFILFAGVAGEKLMIDQGVSLQMASIATKVTLFLCAVLVLKAGYSILYFNSIDMAITNKRIVIKKGIFSPKSDEIRMDAIETIDMSQSFIGKMFNYGKVHITGKGSSLVSFTLISNPIQTKKEIASAVNNAQEKSKKK